MRIAAGRRLRAGTGSRSTAARIAALLGEVALLIEHVGDAAAHAGGEVAAALAEHHHQAVRHVLAAVIAQAFHHRRRAGIAHREALAGHAVEVGFAAGGAVEHHVADQDILFRQEGGSARRIDDQPAAGESLAHVVVGVAFEFERDALGQKCAEALPGRAGELEADRVVGQAGRAVAPRDLAAEHRAHGAMHVADRQLDLDRRAVLDGIARVIRSACSRAPRSRP